MEDTDIERDIEEGEKKYMVKINRRVADWGDT